MRKSAIEPHLAPADLSDGDLLGRYSREGDEDAFRRFADRHRPLVTGLCRAMVGEAGDDAAQAVLLVAAERAGSLARRTCAQTCAVGWLYETARLVCRTHRRTEARRLRKEASAPEPSRMAPDPLLRPLLAAELDRLAPAKREALLLRYAGSLSLAETAQALGTSEDAARMRVNRALKRLRASLTGAGGGEPALAAWLGDLRSLGTTPVKSVAPSAAPPLALILAKGTLTAMKFKTLVPIALLAALLLGGGALVAAPRLGKPSAALPVVPIARATVLRPLAGKWTGTLTYENYDNPGTDSMPVEVEARTAPDGRSLNLSVGYPKYRGRSKPDTMSWTADPAARRLYSTEEPRSVAAEGLDGFLRNGYGTITTSGTVEEEVRGVKSVVAYRGTITLENDTLLIRRETRTPFRMRNEMRLTRRTEAAK